MNPLRFSIASILIASALLLSAAKNGSVLPPNSEKNERTAKAHEHRTAPKGETAPQACSSVTVIIKEIPAPETNQVTAVIQQQPYEHWWDSPNAPEWALFFLTVPYVLVSIGMFVVTKRTASAAKDAADAAKASLRLAERAHVQFSSGVSFRFDGFIPVVMYYWLTNTGHTIAHIKECRAELLFSDDAPSILYDPLLPHPAVDAPDLASLGREQSFSDACDLDGIMRDEVRGTRLASDCGFADLRPTMMSLANSISLFGAVTGYQRLALTRAPTLPSPTKSA